MSLVARCASTAAASTAAANEARRRPPPRRPSVRRRDVLLATTTTTTTLLVGTTAASEPSAVALASSDRRPGPEFSDVAFPRYPGFVTLPSGAQTRDLCVGDGDVVLGLASSSSSSSTDDDALVATIEWGAWTVHQGRLVVPLLPPSPGALGFTPERLTFHLATRFGGEVIPAIRDAVAGMRVGGVRRVLVPPTASASYPYVPLTAYSTAGGPSSPTLTKYGRAPLYPTELGAQSTRAGEGPTPSEPAASAWMEYVLTRNAFTIKPTDRSMLFDVRLVSVVSTAETKTTGGRSRLRSTVGYSCRAATAEDQPGVVNEKGGDGGASYWTAALPTGGDYVRHAEGLVRQYSDNFRAEQMTE